MRKVRSSGDAASLRNSKAANLERVVMLLREHQADLGAFFTHDPRGQKLPGFLAQLAERKVEQQDSGQKDNGQKQDDGQKQ